MLSAKLESVLAPYREQAEKLGPNVSVRFARNVTMEEGIYPSSSIVAYDDICDVIDSSLLSASASVAIRCSVSFPVVRRFV